jgi:hypothetical protein
MRIALVAPLAEAVPAKLYGGTERVVSWLAEELVKRGHRVALFASAESETAAELVVCAPQSLRLAGIRDHLGSTLTRKGAVAQNGTAASNSFSRMPGSWSGINDPTGYEVGRKCPWL